MPYFVRNFLTAVSYGYGRNLDWLVSRFTVVAVREKCLFGRFEYVTCQSLAYSCYVTPLTHSFK